MTDTTRRSFLKALFGTLAVAPLAAQAAPTKQKAPTSQKGSLGIERGSFKKKARLIIPQQKKQSPAPPKKNIVNTKNNTKNSVEQLVQLYMPLCEQLEGNMPFVYKNGHPFIGYGVFFKNFEKELGSKSAIKIFPKKGCSLILNSRRKDGSLTLNKKYLDLLSNSDWTNPKTRALFPEIEKVEMIQLKDCNGEYPTSKTETWDKPLFLIPSKTLNEANRYAAEFHINKAKEIHPHLLQLPPSLCLVVVDLIYNLGDAKYKEEFINFQKSVRQMNFIEAKEQCTTKNNPRRNAVRKWLIESARLANTGLSEEKIKQILRKGVSIQMSPRCEANLWNEVDRCTRENCNWKKLQIAQARQNIQGSRS